jgi:pimeloyl-ACP methyl ester carboxylesterase
LQSIIFKIPSRFHARLIVAEVTVSPSFKFQPLIVFAHGLNGFKDWGPFPALADAFAQAGFAFCRINFSHNGTSPDAPTDFVDVEGFSRNTISIQLSDLEDVLEFFQGGKAASEGILVDKRRIGLMGHSWGASVCLLETARNPEVKALVTLSALAQFGKKWTEEIRKEWAREGFHFIKNSRTGQELPLSYAFIEELDHYPTKFSPAQAATQISQPWLIMHGEGDETVPLADALEFMVAQPSAQSLLLPGSGHTFGEKHPFRGEFSVDFRKVVDASILFLKNNL